jgi:tetratricopeptide (TPR) repeat protein
MNARQEQRSCGHGQRAVMAVITLVACALAQLAPAGPGGLALASATAAETPDPVTEAQAHYRKGLTAYELGHFDQAIEAFARAYELDPAPILLFNIAQSHWKNGDEPRALFFYRRYLEADPRAENRPRVETRMRELEARQAAGGKGAPTIPPAGPPVTEVPAPGRPVAGAPTSVPIAVSTHAAAPPLHRRSWFWVAVVGAGVAVVAATVATTQALRSNRPWNCGAGCPTHTVE